MVFDISPETRVTYINQTTNEKWPEWKYWNDCTEVEKRQANLAIPHKKYVILDKDFPNATDEEIMKVYQEFKEKLARHGIEYFIGDRSPHGFHFYIPFEELLEFDDDTISEVRKIFQVEFDTCKSGGISINTVMSVPGRPHFKTNIIYPIIDNFVPKNNHLKNSVIMVAKNRVEELRKVKEHILTKEDSKDFKDYFTNDPFFRYISTHVIGDNTERNNVIFPNLAIACVKSGKTEEEIEGIVRPIIEKNFPGKNYAEFKGWLKKAFSGEMDNYNLVQINNWVKEFAVEKEDLYDLKPIPLIDKIDDIEEIKVTPKIEKMFLSDKEFEEMPIEDVVWLIDGWIAKGDITGIVGKMSSFKTTLLLHMAYALAEGKLIFNKYPCKKSKVLYLNEENHTKLFLTMVRRVKKGLGIENVKSENLYVCNMKGLRLDKEENIKVLINFIKDNNIDVVIFDSFRRFFLGKEDSADIISQLMAVLKKIRSSCNDCNIINIHHSKKGEVEDERDIARGSSDWGNSLDSQISFKRKINNNVVIANHIKNRSGPEMTGKVLQIDMSSDKTYIWESGEVSKDGKKTQPEKCADTLINFLIENKLSIFTRKDLLSLEKEFPHDTIAKALRLLKVDGVILENGVGNKVSYSFNLPQQTEEKNNDNELEGGQTTL